MFPVGIGLRDPRSQKRDLGHPSVSPFDVAEAQALPFLSRLASASRLLLGIAGEKGGCWQKGLFITLTAATTCHIATTLPFVIPSEAEGSAVPRTRPGNVFFDRA